MSITGVVLAGGQSSRYGKPKMFEKFQGLPLYMHSVNALSKAGITSIYIITNETLAPYFNTNRADILVEKSPHQGPLHALYHAMSSLSKQEWFFVLASDIPFVTTAFVKQMINALDSNHDAVIPVTGERNQPLHSIYHQRCLLPLKKLIDNGCHSMYPLLKQISVHYLPFPENQKDFMNINRQKDWLQSSDE